MARKRKKSSSIIPVLIVIAAVGVWAYDSYRRGTFGNFSGPAKSAPSSAESSGDGGSSVRTGIYDTYRNCTLVSEKGNDGDSFRVRFPNGRTEIVRLYFVDTPESAFKSYGGGRNNRQRIEEQAADLGGIPPQQAVEIGKKAKEFTLALLEKSPFTVHTEWDSPFNDKRYHAFIELTDGEVPRFLHERLVENGLARIRTKGGPLPDGTSERGQEDHLFDLQKSAKTSKAGAWGP